jgi:hypothetical protein
MITDEIKDQYQVISVRRTIRREPGNVAKFSPGYICECANGKWLAISTDVVWVETEILELNSMQTASKRLRERRYFSRLHKIYPIRNRVFFSPDK